MSNSNGEIITVKDGKLAVPNNPIIPFIEGDGIGKDIVSAGMPVLDEAIEHAYGKEKKIIWKEIYAGEKAIQVCGEILPKETFDEIRKYRVAIKGPLTTPIAGGYRSLNVTLRQELDLFACVRPVKYYKGAPSPMKNPDAVDMIVFRENTEDVYAGIEWQAFSDKAKKMISILKEEFGVNVKADSGIGVKPISEEATKRLTRLAIKYALENDRKNITLMHKGNIMKFTEGAFMKWGYEAAKEFDSVITEAEVNEKYGGKQPEGKIIIKDRVADSMFQQVLLRPEEYDIIATPNLNGDYISDAISAQIGGLGIAPSSNIGDNIALFETTHGSAPKYKDMDKVNPSSWILSGALMLRYMGWKEAAQLIEKAIGETILQKTVTYDFARQIEGAKEVKTSQFAKAVIENIKKIKI